MQQPPTKFHYYSSLFPELQELIPQHLSRADLICLQLTCKDYCWGWMGTMRRRPFSHYTRADLTEILMKEGSNEQALFGFEFLGLETKVAARYIFTLHRLTNWTSAWTRRFRPYVEANALRAEGTTWYYCRPLEPSFMAAFAMICDQGDYPKLASFLEQFPSSTRVWLDGLARTSASKMSASLLAIEFLQICSTCRYASAFWHLAGLVLSAESIQELAECLERSLSYAGDSVVTLPGIHNTWAFVSNTRPGVVTWFQQRFGLIRTEKVVRFAAEKRNYELLRDVGDYIELKDWVEMLATALVDSDAKFAFFVADKIKSRLLFDGLPLPLPSTKYFHGYLITEIEDRLDYGFTTYPHCDVELTLSILRLFYDCDCFPFIWSLRHFAKLPLYRQLMASRQDLVSFPPLLLQPLGASECDLTNKDCWKELERIFSAAKIDCYRQRLDAFFSMDFSRAQHEQALLCIVGVYCNPSTTLADEEKLLRLLESYDYPRLIVVHNGLLYKYKRTPKFSRLLRKLMDISQAPFYSLLRYFLHGSYFDCHTRLFHQLKHYNQRWASTMSLFPAPTDEEDLYLTAFRDGPTNFNENFEGHKFE